MGLRAYDRTYDAAFDCGGAEVASEAEVYRIAIVAHISRLDLADKLADKVGANTVMVDDGTLGCNANHRRAWERLAETNQPWSVVLEDDAVPVDGFNEQLEQVLAVAPSPVVSLYLGTGHPRNWMPAVGRTLQRTDACWLTAPVLLHAVAVAIRTELLPAMLHGTDTRPPINYHQPIDQAIGSWARRLYRTKAVAYCNPSLVDHTDGPQARQDRRNLKPRKAWRVGVRDVWDGSVEAIG